MVGSQASRCLSQKKTNKVLTSGKDIKAQQFTVRCADLPDPLASWACCTHDCLDGGGSRLVQDVCSPRSVTHQSDPHPMRTATASRQNTAHLLSSTIQ